MRFELPKGMRCCRPQVPLVPTFPKRSLCLLERFNPLIWHVLWELTGRRLWRTLSTTRWCPKMMPELDWQLLGLNDATATLSWRGLRFSETLFRGFTTWAWLTMHWNPLLNRLRCSSSKRNKTNFDWYWIVDAATLGLPSQRLWNWPLVRVCPEFRSLQERSSMYVMLI